MRTPPTGNRRLHVAGGSLRVSLALGLLLALVLPAPTRDALVAGTDRTAPESKFTAVASAWKRRSAEDVVGHADPDEKGSIELLLADPPVPAAAYPKAQARQTLKAYFERLRGNPFLTDVTTAESKRAVPGTRLYDYTYRPEGRDPVTARLEITLKQVSSAWVLASIRERPRPRTAAAVPRTP